MDKSIAFWTLPENQEFDVYVNKLFSEWEKNGVMYYSYGIRLNKSVGDFAEGLYPFVFSGNTYVKGAGFGKLHEFFQKHLGKRMVISKKRDGKFMVLYVVMSGTKEKKPKQTKEQPQQKKSLPTYVNKSNKTTDGFVVTKEEYDLREHLKNTNPIYLEALELWTLLVAYKEQKISSDRIVELYNNRNKEWVVK